MDNAFILAGWILSLLALGQAQEEIVFTRGGDLWLMATDGQKQRPLTQTDVREEAPACSPEGEWIAYQVYDGARRAYDIWVMDAEGTRPRTLVLNGHSPAWSPSGGEVAFVSDRQGSPDIWLVEREGRQPRPLIASPEPEIAPAWSPLGDRLAFIHLHYRKNAAGELLGCTSRVMIREFHGQVGEVARLDSVELTKIAWSRTGNLILAGTPWRRSTGNSRLWRLSADGKALRPLTASWEWSESAPACAPGGHWFAFVQRHGDLQAIWRMSEEGEKRVPLTAGDAGDDGPAFLPRGASRGVRVLIRGQRAFFTPAPHLVGKEVMLPARSACRALGIRLRWNPASQVLQLSRPPHRVRINLRHHAAKRDGQPVNLDSPPRFISGVMVLPLRQVAAWLGLPWQWDPHERILRLGAAG
jgi:Tol biopolymer transport system component